MSSENVFFTSIKKRVSRNGNAVIAILGSVGSGKSYFALRLGELLDPDFSIKNCSFSPSDFLALVRSKPLGSVLVMDDAGLTIPARQFMTMSNRFMSMALESCRFKNQVLVLTMPSLAMIDKNARRLLNYCFWMESVDRARCESTATMYFVSTNPIHDRIYYKHPMQNNLQIDSLTLSKPSDPLIRAYELYKKERLDALYARMQLDLRKAEGEAPSSKEDLNALVDKLRTEGLSYKKIGDHLGISAQAVYQRIKRKERKDE